MLEAGTAVDAAGKVLHEAGGHGPLVFLATLVVVFSALMLAAAIVGIWKGAVWLAPQVREIVSSHLDLLDVMKANKVSEAEDRQTMIDAKQRHADAVDGIWQELKRRACNYPASGPVSTKAGDAG